MDKVENSEVKEYIVRYVIEKLKTCKPFVKVYGKGFAKKSLSMNLDKVYTNERRSDSKGYYLVEKASITLCTQEENDGIMTPSDIEESPKLQGVVFHEMIHAILRRTKKECEDRGLRYGTGMLECYKGGGELGRGLNEGLTNWICKKAGVYVDGYRSLTNFMKILELSISEEKLMEIGKGGLYRDVPRLMKMPLEYCDTFLGITDEIYQGHVNIIELEGISKILEEYQNYATLPKEEQLRVKRAYEKLEENLFYTNILYGDPTYEEELISRNASDTVEEKLRYMQKVKSEIEESMGENVSDVLKIMFNTYFKDEIESEMADGYVREETMRKWDKFKGLASECAVIQKSTGKNTVVAIGQIYNVYDQIEKKYFGDIMKEAQTLVDSGSLTARKMVELEARCNRDRNSVDMKFVQEIAEMVNPDEKEQVAGLLSVLFANGKAQEMDKYSQLTVRGKKLRN